MASFWKASCNFSKRQFAHISACTMYMLMAVSSSASRWLSAPRICGFPFMAVSCMTHRRPVERALTTVPASADVAAGLWIRYETPLCRVRSKLNRPGKLPRQVDRSKAESTATVVLAPPRGTSEPESATTGDREHGLRRPATSTAYLSGRGPRSPALLTGDHAQRCYWPLFRITGPNDR